MTRRHKTWEDLWGESLDRKCKGSEMGRSMLCSGKAKRAMWLEHDSKGEGKDAVREEAESRGALQVQGRICDS